MNPSDFSLGLGWFAAFLFSTTCHEAFHALASYKLGDPTAHQGGQVSLNPLPHIRREPFGMVLVPLLAFSLYGYMMGWASTPYNPAWAQQYPRRSALMALAGPLANLVLAVVTGILMRLGLVYGWLQEPLSMRLDSIVSAVQPGAMSGAAVLLSVFFSLNVLLFCLNLLPVPPLDGSSAILLVLPANKAQRYQMLMRQPAFALIGLVLALQLAPYVFYPVLEASVRLIFR